MHLLDNLRRCSPAAQLTFMLGARHNNDSITFHVHEQGKYAMTANQSTAYIFQRRRTIGK